MVKIYQCDICGAVIPEGTGRYRRYVVFKSSDAKRVVASVADAERDYCERCAKREADSLRTPQNRPVRRKSKPSAA